MIPRALNAPLSWIDPETGVSASADRATHEPNPQAVSAVPVGIPDVDMPVISLWQPFASLIFEWDGFRGDFVKSHETRGFKLPARLIGADVAIHATASFPARRLISSALNDLCYDRFGCGYNYSLPFGAIIGVVRFGDPKPTEALRAFQYTDEIIAGDWAPGRWAWPIMSAIKLPIPIPAKGKQGWWKFSAQAIESGRSA